MPDIMAPKEATMVQFAPGAEAGTLGPQAPYYGPSEGWYYGESLNANLFQGITDGQG